MIEDIVRLWAFKKKSMYNENWTVSCIWMFLYAIIFELPEMAKIEILDFSGPTCVSSGYFLQYFICKCSFREISMKKCLILDQSKSILLYLKIK